MPVVATVAYNDVAIRKTPNRWRSNGSVEVECSEWNPLYGDAVHFSQEAHDHQDAASICYLLCCMNTHQPGTA